MSDAAFEAQIQDIGLEIFERARAAEPRPWEMDYWQQLMMDLSSDFETLRVQGFRFIDVLPALRSDRAIARHLSEYLPADAPWMLGPIKLLLGYQSPDSLHARMVADAARRAAFLMAKRFIAGSNAGEAIAFVQRFRRKNMAFTLDVLGEFTASVSQGRGYQQTYLDLIDALCRAARSWEAVPLLDTCASGLLPRVNISIKLTALTPHFDAIDPESAIRSVAEGFRPILARAKELGAFINVDMESFGYRNITFELFKRVLCEPEFREMTNVGIVVQAYLRDGERDYEKLLDWTKKRGVPISVRLVKGAYWDVETAMASQNNATPPVWLHKWESDASYERLTRRMLENAKCIRPAFASHNVRSIANIIANAEALGLSPRHYDIQMLHGMGDPLKQAMVDLGQCLRVYTPYGELISGMGYLIRRLLENTANDSFLQQSYHVRNAECLLRNPSIARPPSVLPRQAHYVDFNEDAPMPTFRNETVISLTSAQNRDRFAAALESVRSGFGSEYPLVIEGETIRTGQWIESRNPSDNDEIVGKVASASVGNADHAVVAASRAFGAWRKSTAAHRADLLRKVADTIRDQRFEFAALITLEAGKPWREAVADVAEAIDYLNYYAGHAEALESKPRRRDLPGEDNYLVYEPKGVCVVLSPWSFPLALLSNMVSASLAAGNTVVIKPASATPVVCARFVSLFTESAFPPGVVNFVPGAGEVVGDHLVRHPDVNVIAFTGSREVGSRILHLATQSTPSQQHIKRVVSELGGKNAIIVDDDADIDQAVSGVVQSAFGYSGQKCTACSRVIVLSDVYDTFCERLVAAAGDLAIGSAEAPTTVIGPIIDKTAYNEIRRFIDLGKNEARLILGDVVPALANGHYIPPTVFADVSPVAVIAQEEILGPVLAVIKANDFDHAIEVANGTRYALTGGLFSRSPANIAYAKREFLVGNLYINRKITGSRVDIEPFGGLKMSGDGAKAGGPEYLRHFCNARTITEHTLRHGLAPAKEVETRV